MTEQRDYRSTVFLPKTDFPMKAGLPQKEPGILASWQAQNFYARLRANRAGREKFILHDGPPYANGDMHIGHALNHILKDMVVRTQTLLGKDAPYVPGWDCHGLPIEWKVEEQYRKKKLDKDQVDPVEFRAECRAYAQGWVDTQREQLKRLGINGDWDHPYLTMDFQAEATIVAELMKFAESGQLYRGAKPVMWSPVEKTALAEAEVEYEDIVSTQVDVAFEIVESPIAELVGAYAVIWTTTPWTIPVNQAIAYGPEVSYVVVRFGGRRYLVAAELRDAFLKRVGVRFEPATSDDIGFDDLSELMFIAKGSDLAGTVARHPMANYLRRPVLDTGLGFSSSATPGQDSQGPDQVRADGQVGDEEWARRVAFFERPRPFLAGDFVTTDSGTGLVHMAPDHGEDDFALCKAHGIEPVFAVEADGKYRADWAWLGGQGSVINPKFNAPDGPICTDLRAAGGLLAASADYKHSYPHSWRSKAKVIYRCTPQWFVPMDKDLPAYVTPEDLEGDGAAYHAAFPAKTLRERAMAAIAATRFVPEKGRNRIGSMVEGRPDWVLSRQRAWGVPITLFVKKGTNAYLADPAVNARIVAGVRAGGVDAWSDARAQEYLGADYLADDYERVSDILDVWFDSGCTHAFVLESGRWPELLRPEGWTGPRADLYLEGSDQHRGWFQSSLLEACATRGHAPYKGVLTHGFTMDQKGMKMSKSLGNTISPIDLMRDYGADILRLWALSVDFTEDHRIGKEILAGVADQYRKLRNSFRYLLGALEGFTDAEKLPVDEMPELERYMLALLGKLDATLKQAVQDYDFNTYVRALTDFCNEDLSAFFFDIRKDSLYCDAPTDPKRRAYRTVLDTLFHALVRYAAPVLVFTSEEVWGTRYPDGDSVHLLEWPTLPRRPVLDTGLGFSADAALEDSQAPDQVRGDELVEKWKSIRVIRNGVNEAIEPHRREKILGTSMEANVIVPMHVAYEGQYDGIDWAELCIAGRVTLVEPLGEFNGPVTVTRTAHHKCGRCWRHLPEVTEDGALCSRCDHVVATMDAAP
ncbi:isoleucine--tRNA ligase [Novosphingobium lentum]|uniref:isoleucine--tRNA ligase n=1 Tax=Novosphingobium lentum TaxID=145287 RepID=UPI0008312607|nr:isoleucine--tRNA ligase [Novosphingobium lentum]